MLLCAFRGERNGQVAGYSKRLCLIEEYLVWLPCLALSATRAAALNPSVLLRMRAVLRLFPGRMHPPFPEWTLSRRGQRFGEL